MTNSIYYLIVFDSQNHAFFFENLLYEQEVYDVEYVQAPKFLTASCHASLKIHEESLKLALQKIKQYNLHVYKVYKCYYNKGKKIYKVIR